jgi:hypothetical protein
VTVPRHRTKYLRTPKASVGTDGNLYVDSVGLQLAQAGAFRASVPRLRYDQLMAFGWKILLPVATVNALVTALLVVWVK